MWWKKKDKQPAPALEVAPPAPALAQVPPAQLQQAFNAGFQRHQAGRLAEAAAQYRSVLAQSPEHFAARHLLGVIALQEGRLDEARDEITRALRSNPRDGAAYGNLGTVHLRAGRLADARVSYETALQLNPRDANAASSLATVLMRMGDPAGAAARLREALSAGGGVELRNELGAALLAADDPAGAAKEFQAVLRKQPANASAHNNLGIALERSGKGEQALQEYERALAIEPTLADASNNRASLLVTLGRLSEAREGFEQAVRRDPESARAHANLGALLREAGELAAARVSLLRALELDPRLFEARFNLVYTALESGDQAMVVELLDRLMKDSPRSAEVHALAAQQLLAQGALAEADAALGRALELDPKLAQAHHLRGLVSMARGDSEAAREHHERAVQIDPAHAQARWAAVMARLPALAENAAQAEASRAAFAHGVGELDQAFSGAHAQAGRAAVGTTQPFYLAYQRGNHKELLAPYGRLCQRLAGASAELSAPAFVSGAPLRIGIVSAHLRDHSVWTAIVRGWAARLERDKFELHAFSVGGGPDAQTELARNLIPRFDSQAAGVDEWAGRIAKAAPHVLIYPEIGMDSLTLKLACQRLAPLQCAAWGHPLTTGLPSIDAFLSAQAFEPADAQVHYTEELVALPGVGVHYEPLAVAPERIDRRQLGLPRDAPLLLCPGLPQKYAAEDDDVLADIASRAPDARLVFFKAGVPELANRVSRRLSARFSARGLRYEDHVVWLPMLSRAQFFGLMQEATLFLDSVGFSGFNTAMQAVECGLPIVSLEGDCLRGRFGSGVLRELGLDECVARSASEYADMAVALAGNRHQATAIGAHMRKHKGRVFATEAPVAALAEFLQSRTR